MPKIRVSFQLDEDDSERVDALVEDDPQWDSRSHVFRVAVKRFLEDETHESE